MGIHQPSLSAILKSRRPLGKNLQNNLRVLNVNIDCLLTGEGEMFTSRFIDIMTLSERIKRIVEYSNMSIPKFADFVGFKTPQTVRELLKGNTRTVSELVQYKIAQAFPEINIDWLLTGEGEMISRRCKNEVEAMNEINKYHFVMNKMANQRFGVYLKTKNISQTMLAELLQTSQPTLSAILSGKRNLSRGMIARIGAIFPELNTVWLLTGEGEMINVDMTKAVHIGQEIEKQVNRLRLTKTEFGRRIGIPQQNVNKIYEKSSIDTDRLVSISVALDYNFFKLYCDMDSIQIIGNNNQLNQANVHDNINTACDAVLAERIKSLEVLIEEKNARINELKERIEELKDK